VQGIDLACARIADRASMLLTDFHPVGC
jgi:hypothetical protein